MVTEVEMDDKHHFFKKNKIMDMYNYWSYKQKFYLVGAGTAWYKNFERNARQASASRLFRSLQKL